MATRLFSLMVAAGLTLASVACGSEMKSPTAPTVLRSGDVGPSSSSSSGSGSGSSQDHSGTDDNGSRAEFTGSITNVSPLVIGGRTVVTDSSTLLIGRDGMSISLDAFKIGDTAEVEGTSRADGSVLAKKIKLQD